MDTDSVGKCYRLKSALLHRKLPTAILLAEAVLRRSHLLRKDNIVEFFWREWRKAGERPNKVWFQIHIKRAVEDIVTVSLIVVL